jgi:hypothetical protein
MAVRVAPGIGWGRSPISWIAFKTASICCAAAPGFMTINIWLQASGYFHWCKRQISRLREREKISVPLENGRFLSPPHERQCEGELPSKV